LFNPSKRRKSNPWWLWLGIGSGSSTDYEGIMNKEKQGKGINVLWCIITSLVLDIVLRTSSTAMSLREVSSPLD